jgi:lactoylglutathione lyase
VSAIVVSLIERLQPGGARDGHMAFVRSPDNISIELLRHGDALAAQEPWASMSNSGHW